MNQLNRYVKPVRIWLFIGLVMILVQILVGGITRLTGSGLSITKWEIVTGTIPPMNDGAWNAEFDLYKDTPQYEMLNQGMSMSEFKFIYFWEYFHRLWARLLGFVFAIPCLFFLLKHWIDWDLGKRLIGLVGMGAVVATFGWIMVASGLVNRPWVDAYKLTLHLNLALLLFVLLLNTFLFSLQNRDERGIQHEKMRRYLNIFLGVLAMQLLVGGIMSGMKAGIYYPTWPDMNGELIPSTLFDVSQWTSESFVQYDKLPLAPLVVQFVHRLLAYVLGALALWLAWWVPKHVDLTEKMKPAFMVFIGLVLGQILLGILTVINCVGGIPLFLGVMHQGMAVLLLSATVYLRFYIRPVSA